MDNFEKVRSLFGNLEYMHHPQAKLLRDLIIECDAQDILEIGFFHGKSSAYIASILEDLGRGHLVTIDRDTAREREPNIEQVLSSLDLAHRVTPIFGPPVGRIIGKSNFKFGINNHRSNGPNSGHYPNLSRWQAMELNL